MHSTQMQYSAVRCSEHNLADRSLEPGRPKRLYFVSSGVKHLLQNDDREALKVTMTGLKVFERQELKVCAHVAQDITSRLLACLALVGCAACRSLPAPD